MVRVDDDGLGIQDDAAAVGFEPQTLPFSPISALAVDCRLDIAGKVASFAANPAVGLAVEIAILIRFKAVMENLDGTFEWVFRRGGFPRRLSGDPAPIRPV